MSGLALAVSNAKKLGFSHRTEPELEQLLAEGMDPYFWYLWTDMGFPSDDEEDGCDFLEEDEDEEDYPWPEDFDYPEDCVEWEEEESRREWCREE